MGSLEHSQLYMDGSKVNFDPDDQGKKPRFHSRKRSEVLPRIYSNRLNAGSELLIEESQASRSQFATIESKLLSPKKNFIFGGSSAAFIFQTMNAVEPDGVQTKAFHKRHSSVAAKFDKLAEEKRMYVSPSNLNLNMQEKIYIQKESNRNSVESLHEKPSAATARGTRNLDVPPNPLSRAAGMMVSPHGPSGTIGGSNFGFTSDGMKSGFQKRQESYLSKIQSEKRNLITYKRFSNSGFGFKHN